MTETADRPFPQYKRFLPGGTSSWGVMHAVNRTAGGLFLFGPDEKEHFRSLVFGAAHFCGLEVLTWTCLDNHFHLVLNVPSEEEGARLRAEVSEEEIFARMEKCYSQAYLKETKQRLKKFRSTPGKEARGKSPSGGWQLSVGSYRGPAFLRMPLGNATNSRSSNRDRDRYRRRSSMVVDAGFDSDSEPDNDNDNDSDFHDPTAACQAIRK